MGMQAFAMPVSLREGLSLPAFENGKVDSIVQAGAGLVTVRSRPVGEMVCDRVDSMPVNALVRLVSRVFSALDLPCYQSVVGFSSPARLAS